MKKLLSIILTVTITLTLFTSCASASKALASTYLDLGEKYLTDLNYEQAIVYFNKLIEVEPKNTRAYTGAAEAYAAMGDTASAIAILEQGIEAVDDPTELEEMLTVLLAELVVEDEPTPDEPVTDEETSPEGEDEIEEEEAEPVVNEEEEEETNVTAIPQALSQVDWTERYGSYIYRPLITFFEDGTCRFDVNKAEYIDTIYATYTVYVCPDGTRVIMCNIDDPSEVPSYFSISYWFLVEQSNGEWLYYGNQAGYTGSFTALEQDTDEVISVETSEMSAYDLLLEYYYLAVLDFWDTELLESMNLNYVCYDSDLSYLAYAYVDINNDGITELLIGSAHSNYSGVCAIYEIYTIDGGQVVSVVSGGERDRYYLCDNGMLSNDGSAGAEYSTYVYYSLTENLRLSFVEAVVYDGSYDENNPYFYCTTGIESSDGSMYFSEENYIPITQEKASEIMDSYTKVAISFTPLSDLH
ncbi:MAG: tetratricopeptide repeat protein [Oscillospiraceae bacterium]|nr:tetratricopeptide repeat protein [Oscillospiraceae bacterium]